MNSPLITGAVVYPWFLTHCFTHKFAISGSCNYVVKSPGMHLDLDDDMYVGGRIS